MIDNVTAKAVVNEDSKSCTVYVNWTWVFDQGVTEPPSCKVFCCGAEQEKLLNNFLFRRQEILNWFDREMVNFSSPDHDNIFRLYHQNPSNMGKCYYSTVTFKSGNSINHQYALSFPYEAKSKVFLICVYDGYSYEQEVVAVKNGRDLKYELTVPKKLFGFIGDDTPVLKGIEEDPRQKVLVIQKNGKTIYSLIPRGCDEYYVSKENAQLPDDSIKVKYLTDFIG